ncbi:hypothetical protein CL619_05055 [archaeon]|nr:hypothetical protein [archaeon]|tara:strand:- start:2460 stop:3023 length:564 start_codon:yes stop_codon:yes gene_type:complete
MRIAEMPIKQSKYLLFFQKTYKYNIFIVQNMAEEEAIINFDTIASGSDVLNTYALILARNGFVVSYDGNLFSPEIGVGGAILQKVLRDVAEPEKGFRTQEEGGVLPEYIQEVCVGIDGDINMTFFDGNLNLDNQREYWRGLGFDINDGDEAFDIICPDLTRVATFNRDRIQINPTGLECFLDHYLSR